MVEYSFSLDSTFGALSDPTRRDILRRLANGEFSVGELAKPYSLTFAAVSKHLKVLERAKLIIKRRRGREQMVSLAPQAFADAAEYLEWYRSLWENRLDALESYLKEE
ncbi:MAG: ArsR/SmtB family transcription factor [Candidatus Saccharimonadales bacterium]